MRTRITTDNPHHYNRYGFAWANTPAGTAAHLDFGCYNGGFLNSLRAKAIGRLVGVDASRDALAKGNAAYPGLELIHCAELTTLPFADCTFDSISMLDVLEHVHDQRALLDELRRVLKDDGVLLVTVPGQHVFSILDLGNLKFRFPRLHRWWYCRSHTREEYEYRYVANPDGLVGDVSAEKRWHEHFSRAKMAALLADRGFDVVAFDGSGLFGRILNGVQYPVRHIRPLHRFFEHLKRLDARTFASMNLFCMARKRPAPAPVAP